MKKMMIFAPQKKDHILACYPFFAALRERDRDHEIHLLIKEELKPYLLFFGPHFIVHTYSQEEFSIPGLYKYFFNNEKIEHYDTTIDLIGNLTTATAQLFLKASTRVGFEKKLIKFFYTHSYIISESLRPEQKYLELLWKWLGEKEDDYIIFKELLDKDPFKNPLIQNKLIGEEFGQGYFLCIIESLGEIVSELYLEEERKDTNEEYFWRSFFESFTGQRFVIFSETLDEELHDFLKSLTPRNEYFHQRGKTLDNLETLLDYSQALLTDSPFYTSLGLYYGKITFLLNGKSYTLPLSFALRPKPFVVSGDRAGYEVSLGQTKKELESMNQIIDLIHEVLKL